MQFQYSVNSSQPPEGRMFASIQINQLLLAAMGTLGRVLVSVALHSAFCACSISGILRSCHLYLY